MPLLILTFLLVVAKAPRLGAITAWIGLSRTNAVFLAMVAMFILGIASSAWSATPKQSLASAITVGAMFFMGVGVFRIGSLLSDQDREIVEKYIFFGGLLGFALLGTEYLTNSFLTRHILIILDKGVLPQTDLSHRLNSASSVGAIYIWPWCLILFSRLTLIPAIFLAGVSASVVAFSDASAPLVSVIIGSVILLVSYFFYRQISVVFAFLSVIAICLMPLGPRLISSPTEPGSSLQFLPYSSVHRLFIWQTTAKHIQDRPVLGHGFDTARSFYDKKNLKVIEFFPDQPGKAWKNLFEPIPLHPHNGVLQIWLAMGALGALALVGILLAIMNAISKNCRSAIEIAIAYATLSSALVLVCVSFGIWQNWWLATLILTGVISVFSNLSFRKNSVKK